MGEPTGLPLEKMSAPIELGSSHVISCIELDSTYQPDESEAQTTNVPRGPKITEKRQIHQYARGTRWSVN